MKNIRGFLSEKFQFLEMKFSVYLNRRVFVMILVSEPQHENAPNEDSNWSAHPHGIVFAQSDQSRRCRIEETLNLWLSEMRPHHANMPI